MTRKAKGFRFDYDILREPSKRMGRKLVNLQEGDEIAAVKPEDGEFLAVASDAGHILLFTMEEIPILTGAGQGVRMMRLAAGAEVAGMEPVNAADRLNVQPRKGKEKTVAVRDLASAKRGGLGKKLYGGISGMERMTEDQGRVA